MLSIIGCLAALSIGQVAQDPRPISAEAKNAIKANLDQFKTLVGDWHGEGLGGQYDEHWLPARGGVMMGLFGFVSDGQLQSSSVLSLRQQGENVHMLLRGLTPDLVPSGDKPAIMILVEKTSEKARFVNQFEGALPKVLTVTHPDGGLKVVVESLQGTQPTVTELNFKRVPKS